jgi:hydroxymethylpyrimidine/phosphomethylpyrimidine kinase
MNSYKKAMTIAGSDPSGGAGIQADIKAISACGVYAEAVITSLTSQNTLGVQGVLNTPADVVRTQAESVLDDLGCDSMKTGMLPTSDIIETVADLIRRYTIPHVVVDPVAISTSGAKLISDEAIVSLRTKLIPLSEIVTPNLHEAEILSGVKIKTHSDYRQAADKILALGANSVLIKGGHLEDELLIDTLYCKDGRVFDYKNMRINTPNTHGTGCTLSASISAFLARGFELPEAVGLAIEYLHNAIKCGADNVCGKGHGPVHHFWNVWK